MTTRVTQAVTLALVDTETDLRVTQVATLVLRGAAQFSSSVGFSFGLENDFSGAKYLQPLSEGDRSSLISVSSNATIAGGIVGNHVDGGYALDAADSFWIAAQSGREFVYDFGSAKIVSEVLILVHHDVRTSSNSGSWVVEGSLNGASYWVMSDPFDWTCSITVFGHRVSLLYNRFASRYIRLRQISGTTSTNPYHREILFRVDEGQGFIPAYESFWGSGPRRNAIDVSSGSAQGTLFNAPAQQGTIIDGSTTDDLNYFVNSRTSAWINFKFPHPMLITEATWYQDTGASHGTWQWRGSNDDGVSWTDIGGTFTLGGSTTSVQAELNSNTAEYQIYRLEQVSGSCSSAPYIREIQFKIGIIGPAASVSSEVTITYALESSGAIESDVTLDYVLLQDPLHSDVTFDFILLQFWSSDISFDYEIPETIPNYVTQQTLLSVVMTSSQLKVTQQAILAVALPEQDTKTTQQTLLPIIAQRKVEFPTIEVLMSGDVVIPDVPVIETWSWQTTVNMAFNSDEQRMSIRPAPRYRMDLRFIVLNDEERRNMFTMLFKYQGDMFPYPMFQYSTQIRSEASSGDTFLDFDVARTDMRAGESLVIYDPYEGSLRFSEIDTVEVGGVNLKDPLNQAVNTYEIVCPAPVFRMPGPGSISMNGVDGEISLTVESMYRRQFQRVNSDGLLTKLNGIPIITQRPLIPATDTLDRGVTWLEAPDATPKPYKDWRTALASGTRTYIYDRSKNSDYWRALIDYTRGRQKPFLIPSFFDDLPRAVQPALGAVTIVVDDVHIHEIMQGRTYRFTRIESATGVIYRQIQGSILNFDLSGWPVSTTLVLNSPIGSNPGDNEITKMSIMGLYRLNSDNVVVSHDVLESSITLDIRAVNE